MKNTIVNRCCGNCEWGISPEDEKAIMEENHYDEDDPTRPRAGDCCLGIDHEGKYVCHQHDYLSGGLETYVFYDDNNKEPGYYVVDTYYDHVLRYFKLYRTGVSGKYSYGFVVRDFYPIKRDVYNDVIFSIEEYNNRMLYQAMKVFMEALDGYAIADVENKCCLRASEEGSTVNVKVYYKSENASKGVNIKVNYNLNNRNYKIVSHLFRNMAVVTENKKNEDVYRRIRKVSRRK